MTSCDEVHNEIRQLFVDTLTYPHVRIAGGGVTVFEDRQSLIDDMDFGSFAGSDLIGPIANGTALERFRQTLKKCTSLCSSLVSIHTR